jgi:CRISPR type III-A-associated RAMP protein Csm5
MKDFHKKYQLHCKALSPIHIGSGEELSRWEYVIIKDKLYFTTDEFWELLFKNSEQSILDKLLNQINYSSSSSLTEVFKTLPNQAKLESMLIPSALEFHPLRNRSNQPLIRSIHRFAGAPNYYFPGSSIKGALRGAYEIQLVSKNKFKEEEKFIDQYSTLEKNNLYHGIQQEFDNYSQINSPLSEIFRKIRIDDIKIPESSMSIVPVSFAKDEEKQSAADLYECIKSSSEFIINITYAGIDDFITKDLLLNVFNLQKNNFNKLRELERNTDLNNYYIDAKSMIENSDDKKHIFRCGFGTGQLCNSILSSWQKHATDDTRFWQGMAKKLLKEEKMKPGDRYPSSPKKNLSSYDFEPLGWIWVQKITSTK